MVLTLLQDIVKLMFEMTNASECHRDAVSFAAAIDSLSLTNPRRLETGVRLAICDSLSRATVVLLIDLGAAALESQNRKPSRVRVFLYCSPRIASVIIKKRKNR
jgi:hypothetical protein